jgi:hypothetical protein
VKDIELECGHSVDRTLDGINRQEMTTSVDHHSTVRPSWAVLNYKGNRAIDSNNNTTGCSDLRKVCEWEGGGGGQRDVCTYAQGGAQSVEWLLLHFFELSRKP